MKLNSILCPTDFSKSSEAALDYASALAAETGATLHIVHVAEDTPAYLAGYAGAEYIPDVPESLEQAMRRKLEKTNPTRNGLRVVKHFFTGPTVAEIIEFADREKVNLIVLGTHGRTGLARVLLGSIAEDVLRKASCPVLTVKSPMKLGESLEKSPEPGRKQYRPSMSRFSHH